MQGPGRDDCNEPKKVSCVSTPSHLVLVSILRRFLNILPGVGLKHYPSLARGFNLWTINVTTWACTDCTCTAASDDAQARRTLPLSQRQHGKNL